MTNRPRGEVCPCVCGMNNEILMVDYNKVYKNHQKLEAADVFRSIAT